MTPEERERVDLLLRDHVLADDEAVVYDFIGRMVAEAERRALLQAARFFEYEMAPVWGGDARWISTGSHVADLVADVLRERAAEVEEPTP